MQKKYGKREHENAVQASSVTKKKVFVKSSHTDSDTLTLGIGLHHKSKLALSATVKAKGYAKMSEKVHESKFCSACSWGLFNSCCFLLSILVIVNGRMYAGATISYLFPVVA